VETAIFIIVGLAVGALVVVGMGRMSKVRIKGDGVIVGRTRIPLAGAVAQVDVKESGVGGLHFKATMTIIGADGELAVASFGARFGQTGKSSRGEYERVQKLAARINSAARAPRVSP